MFFFPQGPGPSGKNEEKVTVLTEKIEDLVVQVCYDYAKISYYYIYLRYCIVIKWLIWTRF